MRNPEPVQGTSAHGDVGARAMLVVLCLIWGVSWPLMKIALFEIPPFSMRAVTTALGSLTLYLICRFMGRSLRIPTLKAWLHVIVASFLNVVSFVVLGYLGLQPAEGLYVILARIFAVGYFAYFILMPWYSRIDKVKPVPERVVFHEHE